ncbi:hypothetical protein FACS1894211_07660 [Clostridia bacterium]|nr:hypothetical protein FACS1894211_07660 [Clostridia bacterium]
MQLECSMPRELNAAKTLNTPLVIAGGTIEYHGAHCAYGCDGTIAEELIKLVAKKKDIITAPSIWYSPSSYAVGDKKSGTVHIEEDVFENYCYYIFRSLLYGGFRNIYVVIHHQFERESLMPMTLCYMKAAKKATMRYLEETKGEGWWGSENYKDYYAELEGADNPFTWIKVIPSMSAAVQNATGYDHAGEFETSLLMVLKPAAVDLSRISDTPHWFTKSAEKANTELGKKMVRASVNYLVKKIQ